MMRHETLLKLLSSMSARLPGKLIGLIGLTMCSVSLIAEEMTIWGGGTAIDSNSVMVPVARVLAQWLASPGQDWQRLMQIAYAAFWLLHYVVFMTAFWFCNRGESRGNASANGQSGQRKTIILLVVQTLAALMGDGQLALAVAPQLAYYLDTRKALRALAGLIALRIVFSIPYFPGKSGAPDLPVLFFVTSTAWAVRDLCIYFFMGYIAHLATRNRRRLAQTNAELRETQQLLADAERTAERVRIARDLHDSIGHELTALNLHLDLGLRQQAEAVPPAALTARELGTALLASLRATISRQGQAE